jgi:hypothetical protein
MIVQNLPAPPPINPLYTYPTLDRQTRPDGVRHYVTPDGEALPSVTTILSATADKSGLEQWKAWVGEAKAEKARDQGAALGSLVHEHMECYLEGRERPRGSNLIRQMAERMANTIITEGLDGLEEVWGIETPLFFPGLYAGTTDVVGVYKGRPAIMDFKNAKKMRTRDMIPDYFDQISAYALAHNELFSTEIEVGVIFMAARDLQYKTFILEGDDFKRHLDSFLNRVETYHTSVE